MPAKARLIAPLAALATLLSPASLTAQDTPIALRDTVPIGTGGLCEAQIVAPRAGDALFDRHYIVTCRDASAPIGSLAVLPGTDIDRALASATHGMLCETASDGVLPQGLAGTASYMCQAPGSDLQRLVVIGQADGHTLVGDSVAAYRDVLNLGLASLATDAIVEGTVEIPLTQASDARAFARAQAEAVGAQEALAEAYRRSNAGNFADAAEFFAASANALVGGSALEALLNSALQQSNLGNYRQAADLFDQTRAQTGTDPVLARLARNFEALDALNRNAPEQALATLDVPLQSDSVGLDQLRALELTAPLAARLAAEQANAITGATGALTPLERTQLLDAQAAYIRAVALRADGREGEAQPYLVAARDGLLEVRDGRVISVLWLRAQILADLAGLAEARGDIAGAGALHGEAIEVLESNYPASPALVSAQAQLAGFLARTGREDEALALYGALVEDGDSSPSVGLRRLLAPYFALLAERSDRPQSAADMFAASQLLLRPGLAQTQAVLARELSGGSDEAAQLFRQATNVGRGIEQLRMEIAQLELDAETSDDPPSPADIAERRAELELLRNRQLELQQSLAAYPRYRVATDQRMDLAGLQAVLEPGEVYYKLVMLDDAAYAIFVTPDATQAFRVAASAAEIEGMVGSLRDSIAIEMAGQTITYPFEMATAHDLYSALFAPVDTQLRQASQLVFEPDGAMLRLPANLLVMDAQSVQTYEARLDADMDADPYDYRGTAWLGRAIQVTTAVSPASFADVRGARGSEASVDYLGLGHNQPLGPDGLPNRGVRSGGAFIAERCQWAPVTWNNPIAEDELRAAGDIVQAEGNSATLLTGAAFSDTGLLAMDDLDDYRILHFATHGLVTAPEPDCPPRPALLTSFGDSDSDGLLSFAEIFDLHLDADLVILSACNTAAPGGLVAASEAGISSDGDFALDGLVRAFVGAGGRTVVASHWPVPDDFDATNRLISGMFDAGAGEATTDALRQAQVALMDDADTSHPFYWAAFAVIGDGTVPLRRR